MPSFLKRNQNSLYERAKEYRREHNLIGSGTWSVLDLFIPPSHSTRYFPAFFAVGAFLALSMGSMKKFGGIFTPELAIGVLMLILIGMRIHDAFIYRAAIRLGNFLTQQETRLEQYSEDDLSAMELDEYSEILGEPPNDYISAIYNLTETTVILGVPGLFFLSMFFN